MRKKYAVLVTLFALLVIAPAMNNAQDAKAVVTSAAKAMGVENLKTIEFSGMGSVGAIGQNRNPRSAWPLSRMKTYRREIDFGARSSRVTLVRAQGNSEETQNQYITANS